MPNANSFQAFFDETSSYLTPQSLKYDKAFNQFSNRLLVQSFFELLDASESKTFLELGAHRAMASRHFMRQGNEHFAIAVEANPYNYEKFRENVEKGGTIYKNMALTAVSGPISLQLKDHDRARKRGHTSTSNSLLKRSGFSEYKEVEVRGVTFDDLTSEAVAAGEIPPLDQEPPVVWIDVEGATSQLIEGATQALPSCLAIMVEVEAEPIFVGQVTVEGVDAQIRALGFRPILRDCEFHPRQYNIIYVNERLLDESIVGPLIETFETKCSEFDGTEE